MEKSAKEGSFSKPGSSNPSSKLTEDEVRAIKQKPKSVSNREIAEKYGVSHVTISRIRSGKAWVHVRAR